MISRDVNGTGLFFPISESMSSGLVEVFGVGVVLQEQFFPALCTQILFGLTKKVWLSKTVRLKVVTRLETGSGLT